MTNQSDIVTATTTQPAYRLSILDLMMAMVAIAATLALRQNTVLAQQVMTTSDPLGDALFNWPQAGTMALTFWGMWLWLNTRFVAHKNAHKLLFHPGHLLLIFTSVALIWPLVVSILTWLSGEEQKEWADREPNFFLDFLNHSAMPLLLLIVALIGVSTRRWQSRWTISFSILVLSSLAMLALHILFLFTNHKLVSTTPLLLVMESWVFSLINYGLPLLTLLFVFTAATIDLMKPIRRDVTHWIGVVCGLATTLQTSIMMLFFYIAEALGL